MNQIGSLWEPLRLCLLLYDRSSKLKAREAVLDVGMVLIPSPGGRANCNNLFLKSLSMVIFD